MYLHGEEGPSPACCEGTISDGYRNLKIVIPSLAAWVIDALGDDITPLHHRLARLGSRNVRLDLRPVRMCVCIYVCVYVCMCVWLYVCMCVWVA